MKEIIDIFRMKELSPNIRADIIIKLGEAINHKYCMNITEELVIELVKILNPKHKIFKNKHYKSFMKKEVHNERN